MTQAGESTTPTPRKISMVGRKQCPQCEQVTGPRRIVCECGHVFQSRKNSGREVLGKGKKQCPECAIVLSSRRANCDCGHEFYARVQPKHRSNGPGKGMKACPICNTHNGSRSLNCMSCHHKFVISKRSRDESPTSLSPPSEAEERPAKRPRADLSSFPELPQLSSTEEEWTRYLADPPMRPSLLSESLLWSAPFPLLGDSSLLSSTPPPLSQSFFYDPAQTDSVPPSPPLLTPDLGGSKFSRMMQFLEPPTDFPSLPSQ